MRLKDFHTNAVALGKEVTMAAVVFNLVTLCVLCVFALIIMFFKTLPGHAGANR